MFILEQRVSKDGWWTPFEGSCILSAFPWTGLIKRLNDTGGWGMRWRNISDEEALAFLILRTQDRTGTGQLTNALASLIGEDRIWELTKKVFIDARETKELPETPHTKVTQMEWKDDADLKGICESHRKGVRALEPAYTDDSVRVWCRGYIYGDTTIKFDARFKAEAIVLCQTFLDETHMLATLRALPINRGFKECVEIYVKDIRAAAKDLL